jgi:multidrug resistance efflux pump
VIGALLVGASVVLAMLGNFPSVTDVVEAMAVLGARQEILDTRAKLELLLREASVLGTKYDGLDRRRESVDQAQANRDLAGDDLEVARALLAQTDDQLARSRIAAPFDGVVADRMRRR